MRERHFIGTQRGNITTASRKKQTQGNARQGVPRLGTFHVLQGIEMDLGLCSVKSLDAENTCLYLNAVRFVVNDSVYSMFFFHSRDSHSPVDFLFLVLCFVVFVLILVFLLYLVLKVFFCPLLQADITSFWETDLCIFHANAYYKLYQFSGTAWPWK